MHQTIHVRAYVESSKMLAHPFSLNFVLQKFMERLPEAKQRIDRHDALRQMIGVCYVMNISAFSYTNTKKLTNL